MSLSASKKVLLLAGAAGAGAVVASRRSTAEAAVAVPATLAPEPAGGRSRTVLAEDGVELAVREYGAHGDDAAATVVFAHGYVQSSALWNGQVADLLEARPDLKVVTYDQRGHGRSGRTERERATLQQLGRDLARVVEETAPTGHVLVAGHSMGGMTIMAAAEEHPELFGGRIIAAAFVGTSAGGLADVTYGLPRPVAGVVKRMLPVMNEKAVKAEQAGKPRKVGAMDARMIFPKGVDPALVASTLEVHKETTAETVAAFLGTFTDHDRLEALEALAHVPSVVVVGDKDVLCPLPHSRAIADALPQSELVVFPGVGHMVHLERRAQVSAALVELVERALAGRRRLLSA